MFLLNLAIGLKSHKQPTIQSSRMKKLNLLCVASGSSQF